MELSFLVAEDDVRIGRVLARALSPFGRSQVVTTVRAAETALAAGGIAALVVDVGLPDGSGLDLAMTARSTDPAVDVLFVSGEVDNDRLATAHAMGAHYLLKPVDLRQLTVFAERVTERRARRVAERRERIERGIEVWSKLYELTPAEEALLRLGANGATRARLSALRGVARSTVKKQVHFLLAKTHDASFDDAVARLLREVLES